MLKMQKYKICERDAVKKIVAAWIITVPATAILASCYIFYEKDYDTSRFPIFV